MNNVTVRVCHISQVRTANSSSLHSDVDREKALAYLRRLPLRFKNEAIRPDLMVRDLSLPGKHGRLVLGCYNAGANCYVNKPLSLEDFVSPIRSVEQFWFGSVLLPEEGNDGTACKRSAD